MTKVLTTDNCLTEHNFKSVQTIPLTCLTFILLFSDAGEASKEADQTLALFDLLLDLVTRGGDLGLSGKDGADEGEYGATHGSVESPAHGAESGPVRSRIWTAEQLDLI